MTPKWVKVGDRISGLMWAKYAYGHEVLTRFTGPVVKNDTERNRIVMADGAVDYVRIETLKVA